MIAYIVQAIEDRGSKRGKGNPTSELFLDAKPKPLTLNEAKRDWSIRKIGDGEYEVCSYKGQDTHVVVPEAIARGVVTAA